MPEWKDTTSYRHGERGVIEPSSWTISGHGFSVVVVRGHLRNPSEWVMHCTALHMDTEGTGLPATVAVDVAQSTALRMARNRAKALADAIAEVADAD